MVKLKKAFTALRPYLIALIVGVILMWICTPYAKAHRENPSLIGGEILLPALPVLIVVFAKSFKEFRQTMKTTLNDTDEDDY